MDTRSKLKQMLKEEILQGNRNPVCLHSLGQGLVNLLSEIIREQDNEISNLKKKHENNT
jgi:hypothetical protein